MKTQKEKSSPPPPYTWVADSASFRNTLEVLRPAARLALDMEADSLYHYFEKVCLIQISTDRRTFILDPLALRDLGPLAPITRDPAVEKVFHAATYDIFCLHRDFGFSFAGVFDTHIAAQLLGYAQLGLSALLEKLLGITHSKRRQRDDWSRRPLAPEQLEYAAKDTHYLLRLRDALEAELTAKGRLSWAEEEFEILAGLDVHEREFDPNGYRRIKGSRDLSPKEQAVLRALYLLRDRYAREMDVPPFKVMNNSTLTDLARKPPRTARELFKRPGVSYRVARKFSGEIHRTIETARAEDPASLNQPARTLWKPMTKEAKLRLEKLKKWRQAKGADLELPVGVIFPGNTLEILATNAPSDTPSLEKIEGMRRWRIEEFGDEILHILRSSPE